MISYLRKLFNRNGNYDIKDFPDPPKFEEEHNSFLYDENLLCTEMTVVDQEQQPSLSMDDAETKATKEQLLKLISESAQLVARYDTLANNDNTPESKDLYLRMSNDIIETLILSGCTPINPQPDDIFDNNISVPTPLCWPQMAVVTRTVRMGVAYADKVYIKAKVEIRQ